MDIQLKNASKIYGKGNAKIFALNKMDFSLKSGELCLVLGPSGSGKSTLLNILGGLDSLDEGTLVVGGKNISAYNKKQLEKYRRDDVSFVFQFYNLIPDLTVRENIEVVRSQNPSKMTTEAALKALGILELKNRFPRELSGGQQQRVAIARAIVKMPKLLLCDEPTGALDSKSATDVLKCLQYINKKFGATTIIISHNMAISALCDVVVNIRDGKIISCKTNKEKMRVEDISL